MQDTNNSRCVICDKGYHLCLSCKDKMQVQPWKIHTDTSEHYKVFEVVRAYSVGAITKEDAKTKLSKIDLSDVDTFKDGVQKIIKEINKVVGKAEAKVEETPVIDTDDIEEETDNKEVSKTKKSKYAKR